MRTTHLLALVCILLLSVTVTTTLFFLFFGVGCIDDGHQMMVSTQPSDLQFHHSITEQHQQQQLHPVNIHNRTIVVYAGPSSMKHKKFLLYKKNLEFFLQNGIDCSYENHDFVIVIGHEFYGTYVEQVETLNSKCETMNINNKVLIVTRRDVCYDMEAVRLVMYGGVAGINIQNYNYFIYINCGVTGPGIPSSSPKQHPWTSYFTSLLDEKVKMTGLTINCAYQPYNAHIQSMMYALDRKGIQIILGSGAVFDCLEPPVQKDFISGYERKMGNAIKNAGYALRPFITVGNYNKTTSTFTSSGENNNAIITKHNHLNCTATDIWMESKLKALYGGKLPTLQDVIFFKTSRLLPPQIAKQINYPSDKKINWNWP